MKEDFKNRINPNAIAGVQGWNDSGEGTWTMPNNGIEDGQHIKPSVKIDSIGRTYQLCRICGNYYLTEKYSRCPIDDKELGAK